MNLGALLKSTLLRGADVFNDVVGGPQPFTRAALPDPAFTGGDHLARRNAIAAAAELELLDFIADGCFFAQKPNDMGDMAIWQGVYTAMTVMRWRSQMTADSQEAMRAAALALSRFFYPTSAGVSILLRGAAPIALEHKFFSIDPNNAGSYFTDGYLGPVYAYRDDASLDSLLGAMFGAAVVGAFGDDASRAALSDPLTRFARGMTLSGGKLLNRHGSPTTYGDCSPGFLQAPVRNLAGVLPLMLTGMGDWRGLARAHAAEFATTDTQVPGRISYVNAHLAMLANLTFICAARCPTAEGAPGLEQAREGVKRLLDKYADTGNAFLVYAAAALGVRPTQSQKDKADKVLLEFPLGPKPKSGLNSSEAPALQPVPVWQRPPSDVIWQRSPYPYRGSESHDYTRLDYLIAHYFQRSA